MAKQVVKTKRYLQASVAEEKIMSKIANLNAISEIKAFEIRLRETSDHSCKAWRLKFENGVYAMCCMNTGKVVQYTTSDLCSAKPLGETIKIDGQTYKYKKFEGQAPFYYR